MLCRQPEEIVKSKNVENGIRQLGLVFSPQIDEEVKGVTVITSTVLPGGRTGVHTHPSAQLIFVMEGEGVIKGKNSSLPLRKNAVAYVSAGEEHDTRNTGTVPLKTVVVFVPCLPDRIIQKLVASNGS